MFITPAYAQSAGSGFGEIASTILPLVMIMAVFWFLLIRPQQKRAKEHAEMVANVRRGDNVVTSGGMVGKVIKVLGDNELLIEVGEDTKIKFLRSAISEVSVKGQPVAVEDKKKK